MDRVAVYAGTKEVYGPMYTSLKSLMINTRMDRVYLITDGTAFPYEVPGNVRVLDASGQGFFPEGSANMNSPYTYMDMLRCALGEIFPAEKRMLWLDVDVIVREDIGELFDLDMENSLVAATVEPQNCNRLFRYVNTGVTLHNLELLRKLGTEHEMIWQLNHTKFGWPGQDAICLCCQGRIHEISSTYNSSRWVQPCRNPKAIHYAARSDYMNEPEYKKYEAMRLEGKHDD